MDRILVGLDTSERSWRVLDQAIEMARRLGGRLLLVHAYTLPVGLPLEVYAMTPDALPGTLETLARRTLTEFAARVPPALLEGTCARLGTPWQQVCELAREENVDLIIIGSHGYHGLDRILGTTAARVVNHADRPVLVMHDRPTAATADAPSHA